MKKILLTAILAAAALLCGADAKLPVENYSFTLKTHTASDGKINADNSKARYGKVLFRHIDNRRAPVKITFNFKNEVKLSAAKIHYYRWTNSYGINDIKLFGIRKDGSQFLMGKVVLKHPYTKPKNEPYNMAAVIKSADATPVKSVQVVFTATGGYLSLNEIEFFGTENK